MRHGAECTGLAPSRLEQGLDPFFVISAMAIYRQEQLIRRLSEKNTDLVVLFVLYEYSVLKMELPFGARFVHDRFNDFVFNESVVVPIDVAIC